MKKNLPLYELILDPNSDIEGVDKISFVEQPAIEVNFLRFSKNEPNKYTFSEDKRIITSPALIADKIIYRNDEFNGEYNVVFKKDTIYQIVQKYFKNGYLYSFNVDHSVDVNDVYLFESYIINRERGINPPTEFKDIPDGSWMVSLKVENDNLWSDIKSGVFKGLSVECIMDSMKINYNTINKNINDSINNSEQELLEYFKSVVQELSKIK